MTDQYLYLDETGTLDFETRKGEAYFGVGTAHFEGNHAAALWAGHQMRCELESKGIRLPKGLHAKNDSHSTRREVYALIGRQAPRVDITMLRKERAFERVKAGGKVRLYKMAIWLHLKHVVPKVSVAGDRVFLVLGHLQTSSRRDAIRNAVADVCGQLNYTREVTPCIWEAPTAWGIQVVDYVLWREQRIYEEKSLPAYTDVVKPLVRSSFTPWGR